VPRFHVLPFPDRFLPDFSPPCAPPFRPFPGVPNFHSKNPTPPLRLHPLHQGCFFSGTRSTPCVFFSAEGRSRFWGLPFPSPSLSPLEIPWFQTSYLSPFHFLGAFFFLVCNDPFCLFSRPPSNGREFPGLRKPHFHLFPRRGPFWFLMGHALFPLDCVFADLISCAAPFGRADFLFPSSDWFVFGKLFFVLFPFFFSVCLSFRRQIFPFLSPSWRPFFFRHLLFWLDFQSVCVLPNAWFRWFPLLFGAVSWFPLFPSYRFPPFMGDGLQRACFLFSRCRFCFTGGPVGSSWPCALLCQKTPRFVFNPFFKSRPRAFFSVSVFPGLKTPFAPRGSADRFPSLRLFSTQSSLHVPASNPQTRVPRRSRLFVLCSLGS